MDSKKIGARLRALRGERSQKEVADGERIPRDEIKRAIAKFFGVSVECIFYAD